MLRRPLYTRYSPDARVPKTIHAALLVFSRCRKSLSAFFGLSLAATLFFTAPSAWAGATDDCPIATSTLAESSAAAALEANDETVRALIEELGADKFAVRERATNRLTVMGPAILRPLQAALEHSDPEVRLRSRRIYVRVKQVARLDQLQAFVTHPGMGDHAGAAELPGWLTLREAVGDSIDARNLLVAVLRENWDLIESFQTFHDKNVTPDDHLATVSSPSIASLKTTASPVPPRTTFQNVAANHIRQLKEQSRSHREVLTVENVTAALLMAQDPRSQIDDSELASLLGLLHQLSSNSATRATSVGDPWKHQPFRDLVSRLLVRCTEPAAAWQTFSLALRHNLDAAIEPALLVIENRDSPPHIRQHALLTIAKFGSKENVEKIKSLLDDTDICYRREDPRTKKAQFECQVRDVAFATMIHLMAHDPRQFGFVNAKTNAYSVYQPSTLGFASEEERTVAHAKWEDASGTPLMDEKSKVPSERSKPSDGTDDDEVD